jgi:hypothetical protein
MIIWLRLGLLRKFDKGWVAKANLVLQVRYVD